jgi:hypothetical protein
MKTTATILPVLLSLLPSLTYGVSLSYDTTYDNPKGSLSIVACSDGSHGLLTRGYTTFDTLPSFPHIGGSDLVKGWNSPNCGSCYQITYANVTSGAKNTVNFLVIDVALRGFNGGKLMMDELTGGHAAEIGIANVTAKQVGSSVCGL